MFVMFGGHVCDVYMFVMFSGHVCDVYMFVMFGGHVCDVYMFVMFSGHVCDAAGGRVGEKAEISTRAALCYYMCSRRQHRPSPGDRRSSQISVLCLSPVY